MVKRALSWVICGLGLALGLVLVLLLPNLTSPAAAVDLRPGFTDGLVASVDAPTALAFTPDERMLIASQRGQLRVYEDGSLRSAPALNLADPNGDGDEADSTVCSNNERGLLGIAVDPEFASNNYIYLYYTFNKFGVCPYNEPARDDNPVNRVARFVLSDEGFATRDKVLIDNIPSPKGNHNGGDLHFGKDGYLYVAVGDGTCDYAEPTMCHPENDAARDRHALLGKILRVTRAGDIPSGNPYTGPDSVRCNVAGGAKPGNACREVFARGLRNPFRFAFDPDAEGTRFFINDVGYQTWEEINRGKAGADYAWNICEGKHDNPDRPGSVRCTESPYTPPIHEYNHDTGCGAVTGGAFVPNASNWPSEYNDSYLFGDYVCGTMFSLTPGSSGGFEKTEFLGGLGRGGPVHMTFGPYGGGQALYYATYRDGGQIRRVAYTPENRPPTADIEGGQLWDETLTVDFDGSGSSDPDGDTPLTYHWDFDADGVTDETTSEPTTSHTYTTSGKREATLRVRDVQDAVSDPDKVEVFPGNTPPEPTVTSPAPGALFWVARQIALKGSATDRQDGAVGDGSLKWEVLQHHNGSHTHPYFSGTGNDLSFRAPGPEGLFSTGPGNYLEVRLTATDSEGLKRTLSRNVQPWRVNVTLKTEPVNLNLTVNGTKIHAPRTLVSWRNYGLKVAAPSPQRDKTGRRWVFRSWSDVQNREHRISTPSSDVTYTAKYVRARQ